uniref:NAB domain-containing protein n=1 Tax=Cajanus cajan TaxID=3821 RepID=A0A151RU62_CAJCA|nr:hypothetical protein KK1_032376 [Cajanus cajan]
MATLSHADSKRKYSWWWDSHISPKNSKWLQENLTDMDSKVKLMIKLIEEDADSFARRAEMYYKKRPELMKLVEEFYRAYRALAERYDHATGVIRQAHRTMAEAFPNQVPPAPADDLPGVSSIEVEPHTPETLRFSHAFLDSDESQKDASTPFHAIKLADSALSKKEILALKTALAKLESEKEAGLLQYQQSLERLSNLESEMSCARENSQGLNERANKAEAEVQTLKEALIELQAERQASLLQYQQCLEKIRTLETSISSAQKDVGELNERAARAENEAESLKQDLARVEAQKETALVQYNQSLAMLSKLEERLVQAEENARRINEQSNAAKHEIEGMKLEIAKLTEEKEDAALRYQQCLQIISTLEHKLSCAEEQMQKLNCKINDGVEKLRSSEQKCILLETSNQTLQSELHSLAQKLGSQNEELGEKQKELGRLWTCVQEERLRFIEAETAFQTLQNLHSQSQEELRSLATELHERESALQKLEELLVSLYAEREEHSRIAQMNECHLAEKELQIFVLQEDANYLTKEYEEELDRAAHAQMEIFILQKCIQDLEQRNFSLLVECQRLSEASKLSSILISKLENDNVQKQVDVNLLSEKIKILRIGLLQVLKTLDVNSEPWCEDMIEEDQELLNHIHGKLQETQNYFVTMFNESQQVAIENSVLVTFLGQLKRFMDLSEEKSKLEEEICVMIHETIAQSNISLIYENIVFEKLLALKELSKYLDRLCSVNNDLEEKLKIMMGKLEDVQMENSDLKESFVASSIELKLVQSVNDQLNCQIRNGKELLSQKENEILEAAAMFSTLHDEKTELQRLCLCEVNQKLEAEMRHLHQQLGETKLREEKLSHELRKETNEIEQWETQAATLYTRLQVSAVNETLFEEKVRELADACEDLERRSNFKGMESEMLKERVNKLEGENGRLRGQLAAYVPAVSALNDCITSLEMQTLAHTKPCDYKVSKVEDLVNHKCTEGGPQTGEDQNATATIALPDFQDMQKRINAIEMAVKQMNEMSDVPVAEIEVLPKDIMLDQTSECSYGIGRRGTLETDDQMLELEPKNKYHSVESLIEKELSVDKLEISRRSTQQHPRPHPHEEGDKRKILERLDSDAQKLTNLEITVQDLMSKIEITESTKLKGVEYDTVTGQLEATQEAITKLFDANHKLKRNVEEGTSSFAGKFTAESDESGSVSRRRVSEHARRGSEKIGRLQSEVQRLQFLLLKLNDEKEGKGKTVIDERNSKVLLRDYLYGGTRRNYQKKKKKTPFCGCMQPPTKGD